MLREREWSLGDDWERSDSGLYVPDGAIHSPIFEEHPIGIDLFAGAGGFSCGMHQAGWHVIAALEMDFDAARTYMVNLANPGVQIHFDTVEREEAFAKDLAKAMNLKVDEQGYVIGATHATPPDTAPFRNRTRDKTGTPKPKAKKTDRPIVSPLVAGSGWISHWDCPPGGCKHDSGGEPLPDGIGPHEGLGYDGKFNEYLAEINKRPSHPLGCEHFWIADVYNVKGSDILDAIGMRPGEVGCVFGGPPCQGFSTAGKRQVADPRNNLVFEFARLVCEIQPKTMVMENVPQIANMVTADGIDIIDALCGILAEGGMGTYSTLRRSLRMSAGIGAVHKGRAEAKTKSRGPKPPKAPKPEPVDEGIQEAMAL